MTTRQAPEWMELAIKFGPGWALAVVLVWFLMTNVSDGQAQILTKANEATNLVQQHISDMKLDSQRTLYLWRAICMNSAETDVQRSECREAAR